MQVFINYYQGLVSLYNSKSKRQNLLHGNFKFICNCPACAEDWLPPSKSGIKVNNVYLIKNFFNVFQFLCFLSLSEIF